MAITSVLVIDNHDSFTWNLVHYLRMLNARVDVRRNDELSARQAFSIPSHAILLSPGPGRPAEAGISREIVALCADAGRPLLGVCLGHQIIAEHFGVVVERAPRPVHGKISMIDHEGCGIFAGLPTPFGVARYHSLSADPAGVHEPLQVTARARDGTIQALQHLRLPIHGLQFHPESVASEHGLALLANFLAIAEAAAADDCNAAVA
jgi:anthranilate synthase component 2